MKEEKQKQLGMNPSTASAKLLKDILFDFVIKAGHTCYKCKGKLTRKTFSVEHIEPWLHSEDPVGLFFSLDNIAFSHLNCNISRARRRKTTAEHGTRAKYQSGCKCVSCKKASALYTRTLYTPEKRRLKYENEKLKRNRESSNW